MVIIKINNEQHCPKLVFWDFDGTLKDTIEIKAKAFSGIFEDYSRELKMKIESHHNQFGGMSRHEKIPLYLSWGKLESTKERCDVYMKKFANEVKEKVIAAPWINGAEEIIRKKIPEQKFVLVTATPQEEIEYILKKLEVFNYFEDIFGSPYKKKDVVKHVLDREKLKPSEVLFIGDSEEDWVAAKINEVPFLLVTNNGKNKLPINYMGNKIKDLCELQ
jgi:phosphoglycolate phosphatase-like HAD superfamily hydrolase